MNRSVCGCVLAVALGAGCDDHIVGPQAQPGYFEDPPEYQATWLGVKTFFADSCDSCHNDAEIGRFDLTEAIEIELSSDLAEEDLYYVVPGDPEESVLWQTLTGRGAVTLMPFGSAVPLPEQTVIHVHEWIDQGARL